MAKYRKKPVVIEAFQWRVGDTRPDWFVSARRAGTVGADNGDGCDIQTLEGIMHASAGDWIIQGVKGEIYPCKPDIFAATYEPA